MNNYFLNHPTVLSRFFPKDENGYELTEFAVYFSFHFLNGYRREYRQRVGRVCKDYLDRYGQHLKWMITPQKCLWQEIPLEFTMDQWMAGFPDKDWVWSMIFHSGRITSEAAQYQIVGIGDSTETHSSSNLYLFVPVTQFVNDLNNHPIILYLRWAEMLQARHGTAGLGLVPPEDTPKRGRTSSLATAFGRQFPGVEFADSLNAINALYGLLSPNWLNLIDDDYVAQLGGVDAIKGKLRQEPLGDLVGVHPYNGGVILSSGDYPLLCEENQPTTPPSAYGPVARLLKPLRTTKKCGTWGCSIDDSLDWMARFD
jgi:hypothetical protein